MARGETFPIRINVLVGGGMHRRYRLFKRRMRRMGKAGVGPSAVF